MNEISKIRGVDFYKERRKERRLQKENLFYAQNGLCHLCGRLMLWGPDLHPMQVSDDHLTPASMGGSYQRKNINLAHIYCNSRRGRQSVAEYIAAGNDPEEAARRETGLNYAVIDYMWRIFETEEKSLIAGEITVIMGRYGIRSGKA